MLSRHAPGAVRLYLAAERARVLRVLDSLRVVGNDRRVMMCYVMFFAWSNEGSTSDPGHLVFYDFKSKHTLEITGGKLLRPRDPKPKCEICGGAPNKQLVCVHCGLAGAALCDGFLCKPSVWALSPHEPRSVSPLMNLECETCGGRLRENPGLSYLTAAEAGMRPCLAQTTAEDNRTGKSFTSKDRHLKLWEESLEKCVERQPKRTWGKKIRFTEVSYVRLKVTKDELLLIRTRMGLALAGDHYSIFREAYVCDPIAGRCLLPLEVLASSRKIPLTGKNALEYLMSFLSKLRMSKSLQSLSLAHLDSRDVTALLRGKTM